MNDLVNLAWNAWTNCQGMLGPTVQGMLGPTVQGMIGPTVQGMIGPTVQGMIGPTVQGMIGQTVQGMIGPTVQGIIGPNVLVLPLYGLTLNKDKLIFSGERLLKSTSISFGFLNKEMFQGTLISGLVGPQNINTLQVVLTLQFLISMLKVFKGQHPGIYWTL